MALPGYKGLVKREQQARQVQQVTLERLAYLVQLDLLVCPVHLVLLATLAKLEVPELLGHRETEVCPVGLVLLVPKVLQVHKVLAAI